MNPIEYNIVSRIVRRAIDKGYKVSVFDGEEYPVAKSTDHTRILSEIGATDITTLVFRRQDNSKVGSILLIHGNNDDVVSDHSDNPEMEELVA